VHARKRGTPDPTPGNPIRHGDEHWEEPWGHFSAVANHAFAAQRHMYEFGTTSEDLAHVAVATVKHACYEQQCDDAKPMTIADHQASRFICEPLRLFDCALESDGGGAVIVTSADARARLSQKARGDSRHGSASTPHFSLMDAQRSPHSAVRSPPSSRIKCAG
jgi:acetyl-CoA acetyltransferase